MKDVKVSEPTVERLVKYHRLLERVTGEGRKVISSKEIGEMLSYKASQVRKDLSYFGEIGKRGVGYHVDRLYRHLGAVLSSPRLWSIGLAGVGRLGEAILGYKGFRSEKFQIKALFDVDPAKIGTKILGTPCYSIDDAPRVLREQNIEVVIISVPSGAAQYVADRVTAWGNVKGILNFSPVSLALPDDVLLYSVDISVELEKLLFYLKHRGQ